MLYLGINRMHSWASVRGATLLIAALFTASTFLIPEISTAQLKANIFIGCLPKGPQTNGKKCYGENNTEGVCNEGKCDLPKLSPEQQKEIDDATKALVNMCTAEPAKCKAHLESDLCDEACKRKLNDILGMQTPLPDPFKPMVPEVPSPVPTNPPPAAPIDFNPDDPNNNPIVLDPSDTPLGPNGEIISASSGKTPKRSYGSQQPLDQSPVIPGNQWYVPTNLGRDASGSGILGDLPPLGSLFTNTSPSTFASPQAPLNPAGPNAGNFQPTQNQTPTQNPTSGNKNPARSNDFDAASFSDLIKQAMENVGAQVAGFWDGLFDIDAGLGAAEELPTTGLVGIETAFAPEAMQDGSGDMTTPEGALTNSPESGEGRSLTVGASESSNSNSGLSDTSAGTDIPPSTSGTLGSTDTITRQSTQNIQNIEQGVSAMKGNLDNIVASRPSLSSEDSGALETAREALTQAQEQIGRLQEALEVNGNRLATENLVQAQKIADLTRELGNLTGTTQNQLDAAGTPTEMSSIAQKYLTSVQNAVRAMEASLASTPNLPPTLLERAFSGMQSMWQTFTGFVGKVYNSLIL